MKTIFVAIVSIFMLSINAMAQEPMRLEVNSAPISFLTASGTHNYSVEIAQKPEELEAGLMFRRDFPTDRAMLFVFAAQRDIMMWMKNTPLPLDMVFVDNDGKVVSLAYNTTPESTILISSGFPTRYVVELNAGEIKKMNLKQGDCVVHPAIEAKCVR
ncbi:DUF192 domain-containing protein [Bartonella sp. HY329]|uniref:DUF192 domain-containing protein n=1 Tax=unclassified Bartonella TaxID=2645622 RepID=UPI0021C89841|nr:MULTISPECIES: DUF192 domain-containing protein [unclassified Bartonella]UXM93868.1 DUF192 domain-containing protein [Bartonella sp. HY329]UXN08189.1 DUF192 domain-containing protein [Bartonella sp. HY328]